MHSRLRLSTRGRRLLLLAVALCSLVAAFGGTASAKGKITVCHRVGGPNYVVITVAPEAALAGHAVIHPLDIIPAFSYTKGGRTIAFPGQNLSGEGIAILGNQCVAPKPLVEPSGGEGDDNGGGSDNDNGNANGSDNGGGNDSGRSTGVMLCHWHAPGEYHEEELAPFDAYVEHADHPRDVIPAFAYTGPAGDAAFDGQNLTEEGIALLANGCEDPKVEEVPARGHPFVDLVKTAVDANGGALVPGDLLIFTIVATNTGSASADDVVLTDPISAGTAYVAGSATAAPGVVEVADGYVVAHLGEGATAARGGSLAPGATATVSFAVRVDEGLPEGATILDVARSSAIDPAGDKPIESESNLVEFPVDTPPKTPAVITLDPPTDTPYPGTDMTMVIETMPKADMETLSVCVRVEVPPVPGSGAMGTIRSTCDRDRVVKRGRMFRSTLDVRIPRRAAGRCIRLSAAVIADGYSPRERTERLCVRRLSAVQIEPVTG